MKCKTLIILSFLLLLYIVPAILVPSSLAPARQNNPNMTRDFSPSAEYGPIVASGGNDSEYTRALIIDSDYYESVPAASKTLDFTNIYEARIDSIDYAYRGLGGDGIFKVWDGSSWDTLDTVTSEMWYNGTYYFTGYYEENVTIALTGYCSCDYFEVKFDITLVAWHEVAEAQLFFEMPDWHIIATAILTFWTALDERLVNWLLIFLGLFMIPASTLYLVKGGKDGMSANKFFYFCIAFMLGWGLLLGGIMP